LKAGIQTRLLLITSLVLGSSLSLAGVVLDRSFQASVLASAEEQLRLVIYSLMGAVEDTGNGLTLRADMPEPRLNQPESGLYARIDDAGGRARWRSPSAQTTRVGFPGDLEPLAPGEWRFVAQGPSRGDAGNRFFLSYAVIWEEAADSVLTFRAATDQRPFQKAIQGFRRNLWLGLGAVTLLFVVAQVLAVRWGLRPLRTMAEEVRELEEGRRQQLTAAYPSELEGLAQNLDRFVAHESRSRARYRKAMEDLAHSLKTPLAVIRNAVGGSAPPSAELLEEQLERMEQSVAHQLSRAAVAGPVVVGAAVPLRHLVERLARALELAYADKGVELDNRVPEAQRVRADEGDLMELLGNLLENASKYGHGRVRISAGPDDGGSGVVIRVEDDGPGIDPALRDEVLNRGTRADRLQPGQGIGLAVVAELVGAYGGTLHIGTSEALGGAGVWLWLP